MLTRLQYPDMIPTLIATQLSLANSFHIPSTMMPFLGLTIDVALRLKPRRGSSATTNNDTMAQFKVYLSTIRTNHAYIHCTDCDS